MSQLSEEDIVMSASLTNLTNPCAAYLDKDRIDIVINGQTFSHSFQTDHRIENRWQTFAKAMRYLGESIARYAENGAIGKCECCGRPFNE